MAHAETGTADFTSSINKLHAFVLTGGADAAVVNLREATVAGEIIFVVKAAINTTVTLGPFPNGVTCDNAAGVKQVWFVDLVSGTTPQMTIVGD